MMNSRLLCHLNFHKHSLSILTRYFNTNKFDVTCRREQPTKKGLILGLYSKRRDSVNFIFTDTAERFDKKVDGKLTEMLKRSGPVPEIGEPRIFYDADKDFNAVVVVGLGSKCAGYDDYEEVDEFKEIIRVSTGAACRLLQNLHFPKIYVESFGNAESAAEGATLSTWKFQTLRKEASKKKRPAIELYDSCDISSWEIGLIKAEAQNFARELIDTPANLMTPFLFAQTAVETLAKSGVNVEVHVEGWAGTMNMGSFLNVSKGSCEAPIFLETSYYGASYDEEPVILVGKGITFNSGSTCLKPPEEMQYMRGDMSGAAVVIATVRALSTLQLPVNIRGLVPLCENMPGCNASKPGDIITTMNNKNVLIEDTNYMGRLAMADAFTYAKKYNPRLIIDIGNLSKDSGSVLGSAASAAISNSDEVFEKMRMAGIHTGDRIWRLPLWEYFKHQMYEPHYAALRNYGSGKGGGGCKAAAFLSEFVPTCDWIHLDTLGVMRTNGKEFPYLRKGMTGRPTRTLIEFISSMFCEACP